MKIISWNINGLRAVDRKGELKNLLAEHSPDILLLQEIKASLNKIPPHLLEHEQYICHYNPAQKPGYAGTGIFVKKDISQSATYHTGMPENEDTEGRISRIDIENLTILGIYFPNGGKSPEAWTGKIQFYQDFLEYVNALRDSGREVIWGGDINCAHNEIDLARPKANLKSIGFLPEERAWIDEVLHQDWADIFRLLHPETVQYSWWHVRSGARKRNVGWRIDAFFLDKKITSRVHSVQYLDQHMGSDHCPLLLTLDL